MELLNKDPDTGHYTDIGYWDYDEDIVTFSGDSYKTNLSFVITGRLRAVHPTRACEGRGCAIHDHPSNHPLKDAPLYWEEDPRTNEGQLQRECEHGRYHPDHDSEIYLKSVGLTVKHVCDGCCVVTDVPTTEQKVDSWINEIQKHGGKDNT